MLIESKTTVKRAQYTCGLGGSVKSLEESILETNPNAILVFLFEENPYWYTLGYEVISRISKICDVKVVVFGSSIPVPLDRTRGWMNNQGGFFKGLNGLKWVARKISLNAFPFSKTSKMLEKSLEKIESVEVINYSGISKKNFQSMLMNAPDAKLNNVHIANLVDLCLSEDFATLFIEKHVSHNKRSRLSSSVIQVSRICDSWLDKFPSAPIFIINGRTLYERACYELAIHENRKVISFETNQNESKLTYFRGNVLNYSEVALDVEKFWAQYLLKNGYDQSVRVASEYFSERRVNLESNPYLKHQAPTSSILTKKGHGNRYVFYTSSSDELKAGYALDFDNFLDQNLLIEELAERFVNDQTLVNDELIIRVHPNMRNKKKSDRKFFDGLQSKKNVQIFNYDSEINSYLLLDSADVVITVGSTVTLEAAYHKKVCYSFPSPLWKALGVSTEVSCVPEIFTLHSNLDPDQLRLQALKYGLYMKEFGDNFQYIDLKRTMDVQNSLQFDSLKRLFRF